MKIEADWDAPHEPPIRFGAGRYLAEVATVEGKYSQSGAQQLVITFVAVEHGMKRLCTDRLTFDKATKSMSISVAKLKMLGLAPGADTEDMIGRRVFIHLKRVDRPEGDGKPAASWLEVNIYGSDHCGYEMAGPSPIVPPMTTASGAAADDAPF